MRGWVRAGPIGFQACGTAPPLKRPVDRRELQAERFEGKRPGRVIDGRSHLTTARTGPEGGGRNRTMVVAWAQELVAVPAVNPVVFDTALQRKITMRISGEDDALRRAEPFYSEQLFGDQQTVAGCDLRRARSQ